MAIKLTSTKQAAQLNGLKICVYGASGAGKTRLCATTGAPTVIISAESGLLSLRDADIPVIEVQTLQDVFDAYQFVSQSAEAAHFEWVCLDSISDIGEAVLSAEKKASKDPHHRRQISHVGAITMQKDDGQRGIWPSTRNF
jgi:hypothetical protein